MTDKRVYLSEASVMIHRVEEAFAECHEDQTSQSKVAIPLDTLHTTHHPPSTTHYPTHASPSPRYLHHTPNNTHHRHPTGNSNKAGALAAGTRQCGKRAIAGHFFLRAPGGLNSGARAMPLTGGETISFFLLMIHTPNITLYVSKR